jgi:hypothetical protein
VLRNHENRQQDVAALVRPFRSNNQDGRRHQPLGLHPLRVAELSLHSRRVPDRPSSFVTPQEPRPRRMGRRGGWDFSLSSQTPRASPRRHRTVHRRPTATESQKSATEHTMANYPQLWTKRRFKNKALEDKHSAPLRAAYSYAPLYDHPTHSATSSASCRHLHRYQLYQPQPDLPRSSRRRMRRSRR